MGKKNSVKAVIASFDFDEIVNFWNIYSKKCLHGGR